MSEYCPKKRHDYYMRTKPAHRAQRLAWRAKNRGRHIASVTARDRARRHEVLNHYSDGTMACKCCAESTNQFLTIDHINNDGAAHRRATKGHTVGWLIRNKMPVGFQILCMNCNFAKGKYGVCPHEARRSHGQ